MTEISLREYALRSSRRIGWQIAAIISSLIITISAYVIYTHSINVVDAVIGGQLQNFSYWTQVNDQFQIQRSLSTLNDTHNIASIQVTDRQGAILGRKSSSRIHAIDTSSPWQVSPDGLLSIRSYPLTETSVDEVQPIGMLSLVVKIPFGLLGLVALIVLSLSYLLIKCIEMQMTQWASGITKPVQDFARLAERTNQLKDLGTDTTVLSSFIEIKSLSSTIMGMAKRLVSQEAAIKNAEKSQALIELSKQVAHDIRSPVSALRMAIQTATSIDEVRRNLVISATSRIEKIAEDLLAKYRHDLVEIEIFDAWSLCQDLVAEKRVEHPLKHIYLVCDSKFDVLAAGIPSRMARILSNLVNNAAEFIPVSHGLISIELAVAEGWVYFNVEDNGPGFFESQIEDFDLGELCSTKDGGNGLALNYARQIIDSWGGELMLSRSKKYGGAHVTIKLPHSVSRPSVHVADLQVPRV